MPESVTVELNCCVWPGESCTEAGAMLIVTGFKLMRAETEIVGSKLFFAVTVTICAEEIKAGAV